MQSTVDLSGVTVVIPNYGTPELTVRCARAAAADGVPEERIVVVDNGSEDDSLAHFERELDGAFVLHRIERNVGYGRAANAGARALPGDAYVIVNNDAFVHRPGTIGRLVSAVAEPRVGIAVPRLLNPDLTLQRNVVPIQSPAVALVRASGLSRLVPDRWQPRWSTHWNHDESREIQAADGAVVCVGGEAWLELGGFDEQIFHYAEDLDLCWRARKLGWTIRFVHDAEFVHLGNASGSKVWSNEARAEMIGRSESAMIRRHLSPLRSRLTLGLISAGLAARWAVHAARRDEAATASLRGSLRGFRAR